MKRRITLIIAAVTVVTAIALLFAFVDIQTPEQYYTAHAQDISEGSKTVTLEIRYDTILDNYDKLDERLKSGGYINESGALLPKTQYVLREGDTAFVILKRAAQREQIPLDFSGNPVYIKGINNIYEFSCGALSGWMFAVNGEPSDRACSEVALRDGDELLFVYSCDIGKDVFGNE